MIASETTPGGFYRRTRNETPGGYWMRPRLTLSAYTKRLERKKGLTCRDAGLLLEARENPDHILMLRYLRGVDPLSGERFEIRFFTLVSPSLVLREVKTRPKYSKNL